MRDYLLTPIFSGIIFHKDLNGPNSSSREASAPNTQLIQTQQQKKARIVKAQRYCNDVYHSSNCLLSSHRCSSRLSTSSTSCIRRKNTRVVRRNSYLKNAHDIKNSCDFDGDVVVVKNNKRAMDRHNILFRKNIIQLGATTNVVENLQRDRGKSITAYDFWNIVDVHNNEEVNITAETNLESDYSSDTDDIKFTYRDKMGQIQISDNFGKISPPTWAITPATSVDSINKSAINNNNYDNKFAVSKRSSVPTEQSVTTDDYKVQTDIHRKFSDSQTLSADKISKIYRKTKSAIEDEMLNKTREIELNRRFERIVKNNDSKQNMARTKDKSVTNKLANLSLSTSKLEHSLNVDSSIFRKTLRQTTSPVKKKILSPLIKWRNGKKIAPSDIRIQQVDGGFFERFGALFARDYNTTIQSTNGTSKAAIVDELLNDNNNEIVGSAVSTGENEESLAEAEEDSGIDSVHEIDSEPEPEPDQTELISDAVGWNIDELYSEILYEILHNVGCDSSCYETGQMALFTYLQEAFKLPTERHNALLMAAEQKEPPEILLNVEVIEGKDIVPKDPNGLSDPFVTLYLQSNTTHRYNTSVKSATLNPIWEEHFSLPITNNSQEDTLCLEVWDFDPAETIREKMGKITEVRGVKGLRKLMKEIAVTASFGQHENEFIGRAAVPLKTIPASGMTMWYSLDKKNKLKRQGVLKIRLAFSSHKQPRVAAQEHQHLLKILLLHELETSKVVPYWWCGNFSAQAEFLITQHAAQSGLGQTEQALCQWIVYSAVHADHALNFTLFSNLLDKLVRPLQSNVFCEEEVKAFWESSKKLLPSVFNTIRKIRKKTAGDKNVLKQVIEVLRIISKLSLLEPPEKTNLFPSDMYRWLTYKTNDDEPNWDIRGALGDAIQQGAIDWYEHIIENNQCHDNTDEGKMQYMIKIIQLVRSDLQRAVEYYDKIFQEVVNFQYARCLYILYEKRLTKLIEPEIIEICKSLKRLRFDERKTNSNDAISEPLAQGTTLFELYLVIQKFVVLGIGLCPNDSDSFEIKEFYQWFYGGVAQWLDIAVYKALQRIQKAVELDNLVPVSDNVKYSSSAVDTLTIFYQIKVFWQQLNWPDVEGCYTFVAKIIDDICRCCVYYADKMAAKVDGLGDVETVFEKKFEVTDQWCLAINNIDYVRQSLQPFVKELNMEDILKKLDLCRKEEAERCRQTLQNVIENAIDTVKNKIIELLEIVVEKMTPAMRRLLIEGAELHSQESNSMDKIMQYLDNNLAKLHEQLNTDNFHRTLDLIWDNLADILHNLLTTNLEQRRPPSFFYNLHETLKVMMRTFKGSDASTTDCENMKKIEHLLALNGQETIELIHSVHLERWQEQQNLSKDEHPFGQLTVRCKFQDCQLYIEIMNARNLIPMDTNGACDAFVRIHLLPEEKFSNVLKPKTQTQNKTLFPLFDETFNLTLAPEQREYKNGLIMFSIKDKDFLGMSNQYIAEAFLHFKDIPDTSEPLSSLPQVHLTLSRPHNLDSEALKALEHRQGDKQAKEFLKKFRQKMGPPIPA